MPLAKTLTAELTAIRQTLHQMPELSGQERQTARHIYRCLQRFHPSHIITEIGGHGVAAVFDSGVAGSSVLVRCELDGLPIEETGTIAHRSKVAGRGHQCGHDGHMAIVLGVAALLAETPPPAGRVVLLFQPAEETGQGARAVIDDPAFADLRSQHVIALHNLPGHAAHQVLLKPGPVNCASRGMQIRLTGMTAHASMPETGLSPAAAVASIIATLDAVPALAEVNEDFALVTVVYAQLGERAFGVSPADGEVWATLRTLTDARMTQLVAFAEDKARQAALDHGLDLEISYDDVFHACSNDTALTEHFRASAAAHGYAVSELAEPLRFSEDFGEYGRTGASAMFFLGAGTDQPALHNPDYDFPDALINTGATMLHTTILQLLGQNSG